MLRFNEGRWSIVYFRNLIFIFLRCLQTYWPMLAEGSICWLVFLMLRMLVCFLNGNRLSKCFSKTLHQDFMAKTIYFSWRIWISLSNNMVAFIFYQVVMYPPLSLPPTLKGETQQISTCILNTEILCAACTFPETNGEQLLLSTTTSLWCLFPPCRFFLIELIRYVCWTLEAIRSMLPSLSYL